MNTNTERLLNSIGKEIFIKFFYDFKNCSDKKMLAQKLLEKNPRATNLIAQTTRINCATRIFNSNSVEEALNIVINSNRCSNEIIEKARQIKNNELNK